MHIQAFGLVKGQNVALLVDASDSNCGYGRLQLFQESLAVWSFLCLLITLLVICKYVKNVLMASDFENEVLTCGPMVLSSSSSQNLS